jgi:dUTP pyrophosphatase
LNFKKLAVHTPAIPIRSTDGAAGYDLCSNETIRLLPGQHQLVKTGWGVEIPTGHVGILKGRSGLAKNNGIEVLGGVIDADYRGEIGVILLNSGFNEVTFYAGDRIAQMIVIPCLMERSIEVEEWSRTDRNNAGFGSTGV